MAFGSESVRGNLDQLVIEEGVSQLEMKLGVLQVCFPFLSFKISKEESPTRKTWYSFRLRSLFISRMIQLKVIDGLSYLHNSAKILHGQFIVTFKKIAI